MYKKNVSVAIFNKKNFSYDANRYEWLAQGIHALFPSLCKEEFHIKGRGGNNPRVCLYNKYKKNRQVAGKLGWIRGKKTKKVKNDTSPLNLDSAIFDAVRSCPGDIDEDFLSSWDEVYTERKQVFKTSPTVDIFKKFPCLSREDGYKLVSFISSV